MEGIFLKRFYITAFFLFIGGIFSVNAQDMIILRDGNVIESRVVEISPTEIRYRRFDHLDGPIIVLPAVNVLSIRYQNGRVDIINPTPGVPSVVQPATPAQPVVPPQTVVQQTGEPPAGEPSSVTLTAEPPPPREIPVIPVLGEPTLLQQGLNRLPAVPVGRNRLQFVFGGDMWIATVNGRNLLAGFITTEDTDEGFILILSQTHIYPPMNVPGINWVRTPGPQIALEYIAGPPASLRPISRPDTSEGAERTARERTPRERPETDEAPKNWLSVEATVWGLGARYERSLNNYFSLGATAFFDIDPLSEEVTYCYGILATALLFLGSSPFYLELGMGWGEARGSIHYSYTDSRVSGGYNYSDDLSYWASGFMMAPAVGMRLGRHTRGFFTNIFTSFPIVLSARRWDGYMGGGSGGTSTIRFGVGMGGAW
jgi:hypothetical protein